MSDGLTSESHKFANSRVRRCQVPNCEGSDLSALNKYYRRYKICLDHAAAPYVSIPDEEGRWRDARFCQLCGRFQPLREFDEGRKSCRRALKIHNTRRKRCRKALASPSKRSSPAGNKQASKPSKSPKNSTTQYSIRIPEQKHELLRHPNPNHPSFHPQFSTVPPTTMSPIASPTVSISSESVGGGKSDFLWTQGGAAAPLPPATNPTTTAAVDEDLDVLDLDGVVAEFQAGELFDFLPPDEEETPAPQQQEEQHNLPLPPQHPAERFIPAAGVAPPQSFFAGFSLTARRPPGQITMTETVQRPPELPDSRQMLATWTPQFALLQPVLSPISPRFLAGNPAAVSAVPLLTCFAAAASPRVLPASPQQPDLLACTFSAASGVPALPLNLQPSNPLPEFFPSPPARVDNLDSFPSACLAPCMSSDLDIILATLSGSGGKSAATKAEDVSKLLN